MKFPKYLQARVALGLNALGAMMLLAALQITSTPLMLVADQAKSKAAFCIGDRAVFGVEGNATMMGFKCPAGPDMKPTAVINSEHPSWFAFGIFCIMISTLWQVVLVEKPDERSRQVRRHDAG